MSDTVYATAVTAPFDHAKADIISCSSDDIHFRVLKLFLSLASPVFETLFKNPQPEKASDDQEVKVFLSSPPLTEDSKTLDALLRFCYPRTLADGPFLEVLKDVVDVLKATVKYSLDAVEKKVRQASTIPKILESDPVRCFAIAHQGLLLLTYGQRCGDAVYALRDDLSWITSHCGSIEACSWVVGRNRDYNSHCGCSKSITPKYTLCRSIESCLRMAKSDPTLA